MPVPQTNKQQRFTTKSWSMSEILHCLIFGSLQQRCRLRRRMRLRPYYYFRPLRATWVVLVRRTHRFVVVVIYRIRHEYMAIGGGMMADMGALARVIIIAVYGIVYVTVKAGLRLSAVARFRIFRLERGRFVLVVRTLRDRVRVIVVVVLVPVVHVLVSIVERLRGFRLPLARVVVLFVIVQEDCQGTRFLPVRGILVIRMLRFRRGRLTSVMMDVSQMEAIVTCKAVDMMLVIQDKLHGCQ